MNLIHLVLFFSKGVSLETWARTGLLSREIALYQALRQHGISTTFLTYGGPQDQIIGQNLEGIEICCNQWNLPHRLYSRWLHRLHGRVLENADLYKTNQITGSDVALRAARTWHKPLIVRGGYLLSDFMKREHGMASHITRQTLALEARVFSSAARVVITTPELKQTIQSRSPEIDVRVIPNYIQTDLFRPLPTEKTHDLVFVGRFADQKNLFALLNAVCHAGKTILMIGHGPLDKALKQRFGNGEGRITWVDPVSNAQLPEYLNAASAFIMPSHYEGHPKAVLEAMACGMPVIGTRVAGIENILVHGETGYLCAPHEESIREAIHTVLSDPALQQKIGQNARAYLCETCTLDKIVALERHLYTELLQADL